jgi:hypothetical protein
MRNSAAAKLLLMALIAGTTAVARAVPEEVERAFAERYPAAKPEAWEIDDHGYWEAAFQWEGQDIRADFTTDGAWVESEQSIEFEDLPDVVQRAIKLEFGDDEISEIESVDHSTRGKFFDVEFKREGKNLDIEYDERGTRIDSMLTELTAPLGSFSKGNSRPEEMSVLGLAFEFGFNILTIIVYAWFIYYHRHHDHKMLFLLLGFNLFLFPIFLLSTSLTAGFGFTIFALLALVRMRSDTFSKTEVSYLLGAVALTFINAMVPARVEIVSSLIVLATAWFGDHPRIWRDAFHSVSIRYRTKDIEKMLDQEYLRQKLAEEFRVEVNDIEIERIAKNEIRLVMMYRDLPDIRKARRGRGVNRPRRKKAVADTGSEKRVRGDGGDPA